MSLVFFITLVIIFSCIVYFMKNKSREMAKQIDMYKRTIDNDNMIIESLVQWTILGQEKKSFSDFLIKMGYNRVGIYGYGHLGKLLEHELEIRDIEIACLIDKKANCFGKKVYRPSEILPDMDVIIITSSYYYNEMTESIKDKRINLKILSIDDILYQM